MMGIDIFKQPLVYVVKVNYKSKILNEHFEEIVGVFQDIQTAVVSSNHNSYCS